MWNKNLNTFAVVEEMCSICPIMSLINVTIRTSVFLHNFYPFFGIKSMFTQKSLKRLTLYTRCFRFNHGPSSGTGLSPSWISESSSGLLSPLGGGIGRCCFGRLRGIFFRAFFLLVFSQPFLNPLLPITCDCLKRQNRCQYISQRKRTIQCS